MANTVWIDKKYLNLVSFKLNQFKWKSGNLANCRCPFCGDSKKNTHKARGYFFEMKGTFIFKCHNCGKSSNVPKILKMFDPERYREYLLEKHKNDGSDEMPWSEQKIVKAQPNIKEVNLPKISELPDSHYAKKYLVNRKIPKQFLDDLYFADDYKAFIDETLPDNGKNLPQNDPRIVIPFRDENGKITLFQGRSLIGKSDMRYIAIKVVENTPKIYGLDRFDKTMKSLVVEGPFDSMFLDNCLASGGSTLTEVCAYVDMDQTAFVYDNEPRNKDIVKIISDTVDRGLSVFFWPDYLNFKDINEMINGGYTQSEVLAVIYSNIYSGLEAKLKLQQWKKC